MKKSALLIFVVALILTLTISCATNSSVISSSVSNSSVSNKISLEKESKTQEEAKNFVTAIYTKEDAQPYTCTDGDKEQLDTIWIYYSNGTFVQYAELQDNLEFFSSGTYELTENEISLLVKRSQKYQLGKLSEYSSEHIYEPEALGFEKIYSYQENPNQESTKKIEAVFYGLDKQNYEADQIDTIWIYYDDMTFEQFAILDDSMQLFSTGDYSFEDGGDFIYEIQELNYGDITLNRHQKYVAGKGLVAYESSHTYDLNSLGFKALVMPTL